MKRIKGKFVRFYKVMLETMKNPVLQILPGQIAFFFLLALIPIILIIGTLAPIFSLSIDVISDFIKLSLPASTSRLILPLVQGKGPDINVVVLIILALYLASRSTKSIVIASSNIYDVKYNNAIKNTVKSFFITMLLLILFIFIEVISVFGGRILNVLSLSNSFENIIENIINIYNTVRWPLTFFMIFFIVKLVYTISPNKTIKSKTVNKGAFFTTTLWVVSTAVYSYYITHFSSYNIFYGSAANIIILLLWLYIISYIFVLGMVINVTYMKISNVNYTDNV